jgi:hypothetical protein
MITFLSVSMPPLTPKSRNGGARRRAVARLRFCKHVTATTKTRNRMIRVISNTQYVVKRK